MGGIRNLEYDMLREASWKRMEAQRNISFFTFTSSITIFGIGIAIEEISKYIFLLPLVVILPFSIKIYQCKKAIACIGAYMIVFLESEKHSYRWETDSYFLKMDSKDFQNRNVISSLADAEFFMLAMVSWFLYAIFFYLEAGSVQTMIYKWFDMTVLLVTLAMICFIFYVTKQYSLFNKMINLYIKQWNQYAFDAERITDEKYNDNIARYKLE